MNRLPVALLLVGHLLFSPAAVPLPAGPALAAASTAESYSSVASDGVSPAPLSPVTPVYALPLRVHVGKSTLAPSVLAAVLDEINDIWLSQAGICFCFEVVHHDAVRENGLDLWFSPREGRSAGYNGYYRDDHDIWTSDWPDLKPAPSPARHPAARTAAHECGHGLNLPHRQDSDDNLMRSKTYGWRLNATEVLQARKTAALMGSAAPAAGPCSSGSSQKTAQRDVRDAVPHPP